MTPRRATALIALLALALAGCPELLEPQARVSGSPHGPGIDQVQALPYDGPRARVAVVDFVDASAKGAAAIGSGLADMLATELLASGRFIVVERPELGAVLAEQDLGGSGRADPRTAAPAGQIEGAELLVKGVVTELEPDAEGQSVDLGSKSREHPWVVKLRMRHAHVAIDLRVVDARTSRIVAATTVTGRATDFGAGLGTRVGGGSSETLLDLSGFRNAPVDQAVRKCIGEAVSFVAARTPAPYFRYDAAGQPFDAAPLGPAESLGDAATHGGFPSYVAVDLTAARVYERPDATSAVLSTVGHGARLAVIGGEEGWYAVRLPDGRPGWILAASTAPGQP
ncbi:MAG: CsgG/HfaB family protein [Candidatus Brocadiia bacterium]